MPRILIRSITAAILSAPLGCGVVERPPQKLADQPGGTIPLHVWLVNMSDADPADIDAFVGDTHVITGQFESDRQAFHVFTICVRPEPPTMRYEAMSGTITQEYDLQLWVESQGETALTGEAETGAGLDGDDPSDDGDPPTHFLLYGPNWGNHAFGNDYDWIDETGPVSCS